MTSWSQRVTIDWHRNILERKTCKQIFDRHFTSFKFQFFWEFNFLFVHRSPADGALEHLICQEDDEISFFICLCFLKWHFAFERRVIYGASWYFKSFQVHICWRSIFKCRREGEKKKYKKEDSRRLNCAFCTLFWWIAGQEVSLLMMSSIITLKG